MNCCLKLGIRCRESGQKSLAKRTEQSDITHVTRDSFNRKCRNINIKSDRLHFEENLTQFRTNHRFDFKQSILAEKSWLEEQLIQNENFESLHRDGGREIEIEYQFEENVDIDRISKFVVQPEI